MPFNPDNQDLLDELFKPVESDNEPAKSPSGVTDDLILIVDRSGSMSSMGKEAEGSLNNYVESQRDVGPAYLTLVEFDDKYDMVHDQVDIAEFTPYHLSPRGMTALNDAIGKTVNGYTQKGNGKVIVVVVTDGYDNQSREYTPESVRTLITDKKEAGWEFLFFGANIDAVKTASSYGIDADRSISYAATSKGVSEAYAFAANATTSLRTGQIDDSWSAPKVEPEWVPATIVPGTKIDFDYSGGVDLNAGIDPNQISKIIDSQIESSRGMPIVTVNTAIDDD